MSQNNGRATAPISMTGLFAKNNGIEMPIPLKPDGTKHTGIHNIEKFGKPFRPIQPNNKNNNNNNVMPEFTAKNMKENWKKFQFEGRQYKKPGGKESATRIIRPGPYGGYYNCKTKKRKNKRKSRRN